MSGEEEAGADKPHDASEKKLEDARRRGELPRSTDLNTAAAYGGLLLTAMVFGAASLMQAGSAMSGLLARADSLSEALFKGSAAPIVTRIWIEALAPVSIWFGLPALLVLASILIQRSLVFAPEKLRPKLSRISPLANAANKFGRSGLFEFAKSFVKLMIFSLLLGAFLASRLEEILLSMQQAPAQAVATLARLAVAFLIFVLVVAGVIGAIDALWQRAEHLRKNRMSRKEVTDEAKQMEGDPHLRQKRRQRAYDIAMNSMLADVPGADVVIVNPQHYAVALRWARTPGSAPECVAKGVDEIAARIREIAVESAIPIHRDPPTARALYATVELGQEIPAEHYRAVAAAIRFAEQMRAAARTGWK